MPKCCHCGQEVAEEADICPACGRNPGVETINKAMKGKGAPKRSGGKKGEKVKKKKCRHCHAHIPGDVDICPMCGRDPGVETMTDFFG